MIEIREYTDEFERDWDDFVLKNTNSNIAHSIGWKTVMEKGMGHKLLYYMALDKGIIRGILPTALITTWWRTRYLVSLPWIDYGGICSENFEAKTKLIDKSCELARINNCEFLELRSVTPESRNLLNRDDKFTFNLDLSEGKDVLWKKFNAKLRNQIRKSEKSELIAEIGGVEKLPEFYKVFSWKMKDLGTPVWSFVFFESILQTFSQNSKIILIRKDNSIIAAGLVLSFKNMLYVPSAASYRSVLKYCPNHALYWNVIKYGCENGYKYFDFGRSAVNSNTFKFKKQWVPEPTQLHWQYHLHNAKQIPSINPANPKYKLLISLWRKLPLSAANYLGPKVIKNFP